MKITNNKLQDFIITFIIMTGLTCFFGLLIEPDLFKYNPEDPELFAKQKDFVWLSVLFNAFASYMINRK